MLPADLRSTSCSAVVRTSRTAAGCGKNGQAAGGPTPGDVIGLVCLLAAAAVTAMLAGVLAWTPPRVDADRLTTTGVVNVQPERDVFVYLLCGVTALVLVAALAWLARRAPTSSDGRAAEPRQRLRLYSVGGASAAVSISTALFLHARRRLPGGPRIRTAEMVVFVVVDAACLVAAWALGARPPMSDGIDPVDEVSEPDAGPARPRLVLADGIVAILVVAVLYLPGWRALAGNSFAGEALLHLDYFAMAPAWALEKGVALGSGLHLNYGVGWPLLLTKVPVLGTLSYGEFVRLEVLYGCLYFVALYAFLRLLVGRWQWAAAGTTLAVFLQVFAGFPAAFILWRFPSATVVRWAFDVWFFLACLLYLRTRRLVWVVVGGALVGLAVLFVTETGLYLAISAVFFWGCLWRLDSPSGARLARVVAASVALGGGIVVLGLGVASRWTLFSDLAFWDGYLENLRLTSVGATMLPLTGVAGQRAIIFFVAMLCTYLVVAGTTVVHLVQNRLSTATIILGTVAIYGFFTLLYFVGRSHEQTLFRPAVPFAIVLTGYARIAWTRTSRRLAAMGPHRERLRRGIQLAPWVALAASVAMLVAHPGLRSYPNPVRAALAGAPSEDPCVLADPADICGLPPPAAAISGQLHQAATELRELGSPTRSVAILDESGPLLDQMADARPWGRYVPAFPGLFLRSQAQTLVDDLEHDPPDLVVMRAPAEQNPYYGDLWQAVRGPVERGFDMKARAGPFEIWQRRATSDPAATGRRS